MRARRKIAVVSVFAGFLHVACTDHGLDATRAKDGETDGGLDPEAAARSDAGAISNGPRTSDAGTNADAGNHVAAPTILNGGFENANVKPSCYSNLSNTEFTAALPAVTGFGALNELDLYESGCFGQTSNGAFHVGIGARGSASDAIALKLSGLLTPGVRYRVRFLGSHGETGEATSTIVDVGISTTPTDFGTAVGATELLPAAPATQVVEFEASVAAGYVTLKVRPDGDLGWAIVDDVYLEPAE